MPSVGSKSRKESPSSTRERLPASDKGGFSDRRSWQSWLLNARARERRADRCRWSAIPPSWRERTGTEWNRKGSGRPIDQREPQSGGCRTAFSWGERMSLVGGKRTLRFLPNLGIRYAMNGQDSYGSGDTVGGRIGCLGLAVPWMLGLALAAGFWEPRSHLQWSLMVLTFVVWTALCVAAFFRAKPLLDRFFRRR